MKKRFLSAIFILTLLISPIISATPVNAAKTHTETLDIAQLNKNGEGEGYVWKNIDKVLTLDNFRLETSSPNGLTLPAASTIVLKGDNYIKATDNAIRCVAALTIEGNGTLTLISDDTGILCASNSERDIVRLRSGDITINAGSQGIYTELATISLSGANTTISGKDYALRGKSIQMTGGTININGRVSAAKDLTLKGVNLTASSEAPVLYAGHKLDIMSVNIFCGQTNDSLTPVDKYDGAAAIKLESTVDNSQKGILFGGKFPLFVDYIVFIGVGIIAVAIIAVPIYIKMKKTKALIAKHEKMLAERAPKQKNKKK